MDATGLNISWSGHTTDYGFEDSSGGITGIYPGSGTGDNSIPACGTTLSPGQSCEVSIAVEPTVLGSRVVNSIMNYNDGANNQAASIQISASGANLAFLVIDEAGIGWSQEYDYGTVANGSLNPATFTLRNLGSVAATGIVAAANSLTSDDFEFQDATPLDGTDGTYPGDNPGVNDCTGTLASGATCELVVAYNPKTVAAHTDSISIDFWDGEKTVNRIGRLEGQAQPPAFIRFTYGGCNPTGDGYCHEHGCHSYRGANTVNKSVSVNAVNNDPRNRTNGNTESATK